MMRIFLPIAFGLLAVACMAPAVPTPSGPSLLPEYSGRAAALFDDAIEPVVLGFLLVPGPSPQLDRLLRERTVSGDGVLRARVSTVTSREAASGTTWRIELRTLEQLAGSPGAADHMALEVPATSTGAGAMRALDERLVGTTVVAFFRVFARPDGTAQVHFHVAIASDDELQAIRTASLLAQVR